MSKSNFWTCSLAAATKKQRLAIREIRNEKSVRENMFQSRIISEGEHDRWLCSVLADPSKDYHLVFYDEQLVGCVCFVGIDNANKCADWAFYITEKARGKGIGSELEKWALDHAFIDLHLNRLGCEVISFNTEVVKMHQRYGFWLEGIKRDRVYRDGKYYNTTLLGITADAWERRKQTLGKSKVI